MYQHLHAPLPIEQFQDAPQPAIVLLEVLLHKHPMQRFQTPADLLKHMPMIMDAIAHGHRISLESLRKTPVGESYTLLRTSPAKLGLKKISVARLPVTGCEVFGREEDIAFLDAAWANHHVNVASIVGPVRVDYGVNPAPRKNQSQAVISLSFGVAF